ncbi:AMP-binding protein [Streptomyces europaeiscabiei]|uniref:phenylacetate--CoA ligase family protein n=1 Tax=Streptomyces TaxID=1883 RepID=UPI000A3B5B92|nr:MULTISPECIES: AMP-binding protein [Streptomyces]MDX3588225.1 AMP-binding protein [Streptomyces europaeiscabiei]MDX3618364.1 AMP-binding protein [Streptomyces europaeiscabiei]MDX3633216.1 AMP-binding protein [Streptomyces europaeiscabiei]MDX3650878.1 AMP-binding protein [Streptomyces europaeiscabiei]WUD30369.1 AMP-binding protein [Streptomyces europaeiscabiei]
MADRDLTPLTPRTGLTELVDFVRRHSPFYRDLYAPLPPGPVRIEDLPVLDHADFWAANTAHESRVLTGPLTDGIVFKSGGTTTEPKLSVYTRRELLGMARLQGNGFAEAGLRPGDRIANLFYAGELYASFLFNVLCLQESSVPNVHLPVGSAPLEYTARVIHEFSTTALMGPPTTICQLAARLDDSGCPAPDVHLVMFGGESFYEDQRPLLEAAFPNASIRSMGYGSVDGGMLGAPVADDPDPRVHRTHRPQTVMEIVDDGTGEPVTEPGRPGRLVVTDLARRLMPVIRYPTGDRGEWVDREDGRFRLLGRSDEGARVGPITLYLEDLRAVVRHVADGRPLAGMQVVQRRKAAKDELVLRVAGDLGDPVTAGKAIAARLDEIRPMFAEHVEAGLINPLSVEWVPAARLTVNPRTGKLLRLIDERQP